MHICSGAAKGAVSSVSGATALFFWSGFVNTYISMCGGGMLLLSGSEGEGRKLLGVVVVYRDGCMV